jgi:hypothetical protein
VPVTAPATGEPMPQEEAATETDASPEAQTAPSDIPESDVVPPGESQAEPSPDEDSSREPVAAARPSWRIRIGGRIVLALLGVVALLAVTVVLAFPYLSVRYTSIATDVRNRSPGAALWDLSKAHDLNPLSPDPTRLAGIIALAGGRPQLAEQRFAQTITHEPAGWFAWFGKGLAGSALGNNLAAQQYLRVAASLNTRQPVITAALARVNTDHPMTPAEAFRTLSAKT